MNLRNHEELDMTRRWVFLAPLAILGMLLFIAIGAGLVFLLWNWLLPLFGLRQITYWQALGILALSRILFGGFGRHGFGPTRIGRRMTDRMTDHMADRMADRWDAMTPDQRERFRRRMGERWDFGPSPGESKGQ
jgi:hypothetical protein